jgi:hypothetical protein
MVETEMHLFLGKQIVTLSSAANIKLSATEHIESHHFSLSAFQSYTPSFTACCAAPTSHDMASEADQTPHAADKPTADEGKSNSGMESNAPVTSSSATLDAIKIADKTIHDMADY